jgi:hypothetical protein
MTDILDCILYGENGENYIITRFVIHNVNKILANVFGCEIWVMKQSERERQREGIEAVQVTFLLLLSVT